MKYLIEFTDLVLLIALIIFSGCNENKNISELNSHEIKSINSELDSLHLSNPLLIELGEKLFFDKRLSKDGSISCASCHIPKYAFTNQSQFGTGVNGNLSNRNVPSILNLEKQPHFMFDGGIPTLEMQAIVPIQDSNEMNASLFEIVNRLANDSTYKSLSKEIFSREFDAFVLTRSLAAFERSLESQNSEYDKWYTDNNSINPINAEKIKKGYDLFSNKFQCISCHPPPLFTNYEIVNNGILNDDFDEGRFLITGLEEDNGKFKIPSLRNVKLTFPYMHNGTYPNLESVILHYAKGGELTNNQDPRITPFEINQTELENLIYFLESLLDTSYLEKK